LQNAERYLRVRERAFVDDVTDLYNARYLLEATEREVRRAERYGNALSILFLDLDRFKLVNDQHGHLVGSGALRQLAQVLLQCVRTVDTVARYGGDEFTIILVDTEEDVAGQIAERIRQAVETTSFEATDGVTLRLTCSVGIAAYPAHGSRPDELLDAADKAMYRAKSNGRNKVCSASELD
jgi:diguanylate cyclase (GGDEF)-like protein